MTILSERVIEHTLPNGLRVLLCPEKKSPVCSVWMWYRVGARYEQPGKTGLSHWVEHMLFKGSRLFGKGEIFKEISRRGGRLNGFTSHDYTAYFETLPVCSLDFALTVERDRMTEATFEPEEVEAERTVIISEREGAENYPEFCLAEEVASASFRFHPYGQPVIGTKNDLRSMTRDDLFQYYRNYYAPNNAVLVITGDIETARTLELVRKRFGDAEASSLPDLLTPAEPPQEAERRIILRKPGGAPILLVNYRAPSVSHEDVPALLLISTILSGASAGSARGLGAGTSRLVKALVRKQLASSVTAGLLLNLDPSVFQIRVTVGSEVAPERAEKALFREIEKLKDSPPPEAELRKARDLLRCAYQYSLDGATALAMLTGYSEMLSSYRLFDELIAKVDSVDASSIREVSRKYFSKSSRTVGCFIPTERVTLPEYEGEPHIAWLSGFRLPAVERAETPEGATVLCAKTETPGVVSVLGSIATGSCYDGTKPGLSSLTASVASRATENRSYRRIYNTLDSIGATLSLSSRVYVTVFTLRCRTRSLRKVLEILFDILLHPSFPDEEHERAVSEATTALRRALESTQYLAYRSSLRLLYPEAHPYRMPSEGELGTLQALVPDDLKRFHATTYGADGMIFACIGDIKPSRVISLVAENLEGWKSQSRPALKEPRIELPSEPLSTRIVLEEKSQSDIVIAYKGVSRDHPDYPALDQATLILGGFGLMGRLGEKIRDEMGLAYYATAGFSPTKGEPPWTIRAGVNPQNLSRALNAILDELKRLSCERPSSSELEDVQSYLLGSMPLSLETDSGIASTIHNLEYFGLGLDYPERYPEVVRSVTGDDVQRIAQQYLPPDRYCLGIAGPESDEDKV